VDHRGYRNSLIAPTWHEYLDDEHFKSVSLNAVTDTLIGMICHAVDSEAESIGIVPSSEETGIQTNENGEICW
jgi:hypothetical protein